MQHIVAFSGGKDSTAMLLMMLERGMRVDRVINVDTTKEFPQMYEHIEKVREMIAPLEIETVKIDFDYWFSEHVRTRGKNIGKKGYGFPSCHARWCTALKQEVSIRLANRLDFDNRSRYQQKHLNSHIEYHGIAFDEKHRTERNYGREIRYPLVDWGVAEGEALAYCYARGLDWGGLYEKFVRVSCWCCPMSRIAELRILYNEYPDLWSQLEGMQEVTDTDFRDHKKVHDFSRRFAAENNQLRWI